MSALVKLIHRVEDALLVFLLTVMIALACSQILARNLFDHGFIWIDPLLRVLVLWLGLIGATVASRDNKHIRIDLLSNAFNKNNHRLIQSMVGFFSSFICAVIAWYGFSWIALDYQDGLIGVAGIPAWLLEIVIPISFALIGARYFSLSWCWMRLYFYHLKHEEAGPE
ncbi:MAG: C4-dicarboxylate transporter DctQ subunit [Planctomycetota bacterium]|jgi:C4-dicarboxylate transporter DctQ subunit